MMTVGHMPSPKETKTGDHMEINTTDRITKIDTEEAHRHASDTHHLHRMVKDEQDIHSSPYAPLLILGLERPG